MLSLLLQATPSEPFDAPAGSSVTGLVVICGFIGLCYAAFNAYLTRRISLHEAPTGTNQQLVSENGQELVNDVILADIREISEAISVGANAFLFAEYKYLSVFMVIFTCVILIIISIAHRWQSAIFTAIAFNVGGITSLVSGFIGMRIAVSANSRTCIMASKGYHAAFSTAFRAGCVMGFALVSIGVCVLYILMGFYTLYFRNIIDDQDEAADMFECVAGYGLGGSSIALFGRVGGGIYTKAADVGADLVGKLELDIPEDDPRNPAVIADNVGDNVGDIAGMGADLFGSFAEATCAAMVIAAQSVDLHQHWSTITMPILICTTGIIVCLLTTLISIYGFRVDRKEAIETSLKIQIIVSTILMTPVVFVLTWFYLPENHFVVSSKTAVRNYYVFFCIACGLWTGMIIGLTTEYYTSHSYRPVREVASSCLTGAATNIIFGLALGYKSVIIPVISLAFTIYISYELAGMYGIAMGALGILSTLCVGLTIDAYGPISDNAGGIAEMSHMDPSIREKTDALDAAGNTTAAIGKGFAIGSAALVSLALFGAFVTTTKMDEIGVDILQPFQFAGLLIGAMLPYWFSALTMKSVGQAAKGMVQEVRRQFETIQGLMERTAKPDYAACVAISTRESLREMIAPGLLVILTPLVVGFFFGVKALSGVLAGALVSGVQIAISSSNTGGAWDNAKKYIEGNNLLDDEGKPVGGKGSAAHKAAVVGDTVGDPLKDTSGPSLNILIKVCY